MGKEIQITNNSLNGIFSYLRQHSCIEDEIKITYSSTANSYFSEFQYQILKIENSSKCFISKNIDNSWLCIEFTRYQIIPKSYTIRSSNMSNNYFPRNWIIEGSTNKSDWTKLDEQKECHIMNGPNRVQTFQIQNEGLNEFKFIRMRITGRSWTTCGDNNRLTISSIEFYGQLI